MRIRKKGVKLFALLAVAGLLAAGWLYLKPDNTKPATTTKPAATAPQTTDAATTERGADPSKAIYIETEDFKYEKPAGWAEISPKILESNGSASGIGRPTEPVGTFSIKVSSSVPKDSTDLRSGTLNELKKFTNFKLDSNKDIKVDGKAGQRFIYNFTDSDGKNKTAQQMDVVVNKQKTFFLLFSSSFEDYNKQTKDFDKIIATFKFK